MTSPYHPPQRQALTELELAEQLSKLQSSGGALAALEFLQEQNRLRAADEIAFLAWVKQMEADGSQQALDALSEARAKAWGLSVETSFLDPQVKSTLEGDLAALGDWQGRAAEAEAKRQAAEQLRIEAELAATQAAEEEARIAAELETEAQRVAAELAAELSEAAARDAERRAVERQDIERMIATASRLERQAAEAVAASFAELLAREQQKVETNAAPKEVTEVELQPQRASDFATGGFDIIETAQLTVIEEVDAKTLDELTAGEDIAFKTETSQISNKSKRPLPTFAQLAVWPALTAGPIAFVCGALISSTGLSTALSFFAIALGFVMSALLITASSIGFSRGTLATESSWIRIVALASKLLVAVITSTWLGYEIFNGTVQGLPRLDQPIASSVSLNWLQLLASALILLCVVVALLSGRILVWKQLAIGIVGVLLVIILVSSSFSASTFSWNFSTGPELATAIALAGLLSAVFGSLWAGSAKALTAELEGLTSASKAWLWVFLPVAAIGSLSTMAGVLAYSAVGRKGSSVFDSLAGGYSAPAASALLILCAAQLVVWLTSQFFTLRIELNQLGSKLNRWVASAIILVAAIATAAIASALDAEGLRTTFLIAAVVLLALNGTRLAQSIRGATGKISVVQLVAFAVAVFLGLSTVSTSLDAFQVTDLIGGNLAALDFKDGQFGLLIALLTSFLIGLFQRKQILSSQTGALRSNTASAAN